MKAQIKLQLRLPQEMRDALEQDARNNERSMNGQILFILKEHFRKAGITSESGQIALIEGGSE